MTDLRKPVSRRAVAIMTCADCGALARPHPAGRCHGCRALRIGRAKRARLRERRRQQRQSWLDRRRQEAAELEAERQPDSDDPPDSPQW